MQKVRIKRPKAPSKESRKGLIKKVKPEKKESFRFLGELEPGEIASVNVYGYENGIKSTIFTKVVYRGKDITLNRVHRKSKLKYELIEVEVVMKWNKYGFRIL